MSLVTILADANARAPRTFSSRRCTQCFICPQPQDIEYWFGSGQADYASHLCLRCRGMQNTPRPVIYLWSKLLSTPDTTLEKSYIPRNARELWWAATHGTHAYVSDGERVWRWPPSLEASLLTLLPQDLETFITGAAVRWVGDERPIRLDTKPPEPTESIYCTYSSR